ncbi:MULTISPECIES: TRAP transporter small permease subunit [unclassified Halomonas]|uniref:TRAP transporter small permease subunit n=1 Tax=unclassified Halomonas TaxID=2609666 RepID=UPI0006DB3147|nr:MULTISPECIES: TRAP transporter small permease [unclassified Halomonas]KPQ22083.1 MAG: TRAP-type C4-dicarboxylate transport system, small permease component [Halomonas sp. HL-93]SBR45938.1 TRAP-type C4-dicarboxylate transport system, small permease component [Halomonas sp. HL-93]SNY98518.1 TRAP-type C4-dicarboxylate transport system, small permease component [Halomonas sp. hl-4]
MTHSPSFTANSRGGPRHGYVRLMDRISRWMAYLAAALFVAGTFVICQMVFMRYVIGVSTSWQTEFTVFSVTAAMLLGSPYVLMTGGHVAVTVLPDKLGGTPKRIMNLVASLVGLGFCACLAYAAWVYVFEAWHGGWTTGTVWNPPLWPPVLTMAVGTTQLTLQYVAEIMRGEN